MNVTNDVGVFTDNTRRKEDELHLQFLGNHDSLTRLWNRNGMMARFAEEIVRAREGARQLALLFIDFGRFKAVNDTLGHSCHSAIFPLAGVEVFRLGELLPLVQYLPTLGVEMIGTNGVRLSRTFMFLLNRPMSRKSVVMRLSARTESMYNGSQLCITARAVLLNNVMDSLHR